MIYVLLEYDLMVEKFGPIIFRYIILVGEYLDIL